MNPKQAREFIEKYPNARSFVKPSHLEELSQLFEVHIEAIECRKDEFHEMDGGKAYMPKKETLDKFAAAAGVSYNEAAESTRKEADGAYVGRSQAMVMGPDGKMILGSACEYEFDPETRTDEARLTGKADWDKKDQFGRPGRIDYTERELEKERINFRKVGRQRANTGARNRATVSILGMPTGIKGLFEKKDPDNKIVVFLFSRIIVNAKNELVMNRMLNSIGGNTAALFGPTAIAAPHHVTESQLQAEPRNVTESAAPEQPADTGGLPDGDLFGEEIATPEDEREAALNTLNDYLVSDYLSSKQKAAIKGIVDDPKTPLETLKKYLGLCKDQAAARGAA